MSNKIIAQAISAVLALGLTSTTTAALAEEAKPSQQTTPANPMMQMGNVNGMEKCYGVSKAGMNDCGNASHGCSSEAKLDRAKTEWIFVPTGLCKKLVGGNLEG